jgi:hypothetical protein
MKTNSRKEKIKSYLKELTIVTIGVLIALFISNLKEKNQARNYQIASIETVNNEIETNYSVLNDIIEKQTSLLDTVNKYSEHHISIVDLFQKTGGLQLPTLSNTGLEFYSRNQIYLIDFEMMSILIRMNTLSELIDAKLEKFMDYLYPNLFVNSRESKNMIIMHLRNALETETQLMHLYENYTDDYIKTTHKQ